MSKDRRVKWYNTTGEATPSRYVEVESSFNSYLALVDATVTTLQATKVDLKTATDLCADTGGDACTDAAQLEVYVGELASDVTQLSTEKALSQAFLADVAGTIDGVDSTSTTAEILSALDTKVSGLDATISTQETNILNLEAAADTKENELLALETSIATALDSINGDSDLDMSLITGGVATALSNLNEIVDGKTVSMSELNSTINDIQGNVSGWLTEYGGSSLTDGGDADNDTTNLNGQMLELKNTIDAYYNNLAIGASTASAADIASIQSTLDNTTAAANAAAATAIGTAATLASETANILANESEALVSKTNDFIALETEIAGYESDLDDAIAELGDGYTGADFAVADLATEWRVALTDYNATVVLLDASEAAELVLVGEKNALDAEIVVLNQALDSKEVVLQSANESIEEFNNLSDDLETEISTLESSLESMGYSVDGASITGGFNGEEWSSFKGDGASDFKKLLFRGVKARRAYSNMSGNGESKNVTANKPKLVFNASGSNSPKSRLLRNTAIVLGLLCLAKVVLKK
jgi:hypothetical protein|tara:strand:+ start:175 stop:1770 length:1596 start_codon:yes stop_codon:yes gene_type:complete